MFTVNVYADKIGFWAGVRFPSRIINADYSHIPVVSRAEHGWVVTFRRMFGGPQDTPAVQAACQKTVSAIAAEFGWTTTAAAKQFRDTLACPADSFTLPDYSPALISRFFPDVLKREAYIRAVYDRVRQSVDSRYTDRQHTLLTGDPAAGKTRILRGFARVLGDRHCWHLDMNRVSQAGLENAIIERAKAGKLQRFLLLEEIEKAGKPILGALIPLMDERARIEKLTAKSYDAVDAPCVVLATANDLKKLNKNAPWLVSRFGLPMKVERPDRELMADILTQHVEQTGGGDPDCVEIVIEIMFDRLGSRDARVGKALLASRDRLKDPTFIAEFRQVYGV